MIADSYGNRWPPTLAEAAALLVLQGKVRAFLASEDEEGGTGERNE